MTTALILALVPAAMAFAYFLSPKSSMSQVERDNREAQKIHARHYQENVRRIAAEEAAEAEKRSHAHAPMNLLPFDYKPLRSPILRRFERGHE